MKCKISLKFINHDKSRIANWIDQYMKLTVSEIYIYYNNENYNANMYDWEYFSKHN